MPNANRNLISIDTLKVGRLQVTYKYAPGLTVTRLIMEQSQKND